MTRGPHVRQVDPAQFADRPKLGRPRILSERQQRYLWRAVRIRRRLTNKALCVRLGIKERTLREYIERHYSGRT